MAGVEICDLTPGNCYLGGVSDCKPQWTRTSPHVTAEVQNLLDRGVLPGEIGIFSRVKTLLKPIEKQLANADILYVRLDDQGEGQNNAVSTGKYAPCQGA